ncbi:MAG: hypothetical protein PQJ46_09860 [Spirochaetales bacterium]|nr:hypothetical protein [Spirochaetales bacterium]
MEHYPTTRKLHTDILENKYGTIQVNVINHTSKTRTVHLVDNKNISRTFAVTFFDFEWNSEIKKIDQAIKNGNLMGKTFRKYGFEVRKNVVGVFIQPLAASLKKDFLTEQNSAKVRLTEFYAKSAKTAPVIYGLVAEVYSPDFRYPEINDYDLSQINPTTNSLKELGIDEIRIWDGLKSPIIWKNLPQDELNKAKQKSLLKIEEYKQKIEKTLYQLSLF